MRQPAVLFYFMVFGFAAHLPFGSLSIFCFKITSSSVRQTKRETSRWRKWSIQQIKRYFLQTILPQFTLDKNPPTPVEIWSLSSKGKRYNRRSFSGQMTLEYLSQYAVIFTTFLARCCEARWGSIRCSICLRWKWDWSERYKKWHCPWPGKLLLEDVFNQIFCLRRN